MNSSKVKAPFMQPLAFIVADPKFVTITKDPSVVFGMGVSTPEEVLEVADNCYHKHVVLPYTELVIRTLMAHNLYNQLFIVYAQHGDLTSEDSLTVRFGIDKIRLFPTPDGYADIVNGVIEYLNR